MFQETRRLEGSEQAHPPQPLCISDCGSNVRVRVAELSDGWEVQGASRDARSRLQEVCKQSSTGGKSEDHCRRASQITVLIYMYFFFIVAMITFEHT